MQVPIDEERLAELVDDIVEGYRSHQDPFELLPEQKAAKGIDDEREKALFFTFGIATDYHRPSDKHWKTMASLRRSYTRFFEPSHFETVDRTEELSEVLSEHSYFRPNRDAKNWATIAKTLTRDYDDDPRNILEQNGNDALAVLREMRSGDFPQFGGKKIGPVWVRIMSEEFETLDNIEKITFPVDSQTRKVTRFLLGEEYNDDEIRTFWESFCGSYGFEPLVVDQALWSIGSNWGRGEEYLRGKMVTYKLDPEPAENLALSEVDHPDDHCHQ